MSKKKISKYIDKFLFTLIVIAFTVLSTGVINNHSSDSKLINYAGYVCLYSFSSWFVKAIWELDA